MILGMDMQLESLTPDDTCSYWIIEQNVQIDPLKYWLCIVYNVVWIILEYCSPVKHLYNYLYFPQTDYTPTNEA